MIKTVLGSLVADTTASFDAATKVNLDTTTDSYYPAANVLELSSPPYDKYTGSLYRFWPMNTTGAFNTILDVVGGITGSPAAKATWVASTGMWGSGAFNFQGVTTSFINIGSKTVTTNTSGAICAWIFPKNNTGTRVIIGKADATLNQYTMDVTFETVSGNLYCQTGSSTAGNIWASSLAPTLGAWHFVCVSFPGSNTLGMFYMDGSVQDFIQGMNPNAPATQWRRSIGQPGQYAGNWFSGLIDHVMVFSKAIGSGDMDYIRNSGLLYASGADGRIHWTKATPSPLAADQNISGVSITTTNVDANNYIYQVNVQTSGTSPTVLGSWCGSISTNTTTILSPGSFNYTGGAGSQLAVKLFWRTIG